MGTTVPQDENLPTCVTSGLKPPTYHILVHQHWLVHHGLNNSATKAGPHYVSGPWVRFALLELLVLLALLGSIKINLNMSEALHHPCNHLASIASTGSPISRYTCFTAPKLTQYKRNRQKRLVGARLCV